MNRKYILPLLLLLQIIIVRILSLFPQWIERFYSNGFYPFMSKGMRIVLGSIPFSVGDCIYTLLILMAIKWFWIKRKSWKLGWKDRLLEILSVFSVFYFLFH